MPTSPDLPDFAAWAGRVVRPAPADIASWRLPEPQKAALLTAGVPLIEDLIHRVSFAETPAGYVLATFDDQDEIEAFRHTFDYGALPGSGEVREHGEGGRLINSTVVHWLRSLHLVGVWRTGSVALAHWDEDEETEERALAEIDDLLARIGEIDPAAIGDGAHRTHFWPAVLGRWLF